MHIPRLSSAASLLLLLSTSSSYFAQAAAVPPQFAATQDGTTSATSPTATLLACLKPLGSKFLTSNDPQFEQERYDFDLRYTYLPQVIVMASTVSDVQTATKCATDSGVAVAPRSGGHSYEGYSIGGQNGAMVIDLTGFNQISVSASGVAKVGAGLLLGSVYLELYKKGGWTLSGGSCPSVGVGGHTLGGGFGFLSRKFGLLMDSVLEMEFVNAKGEAFTVSATSNPDLFFALRGAGGGSYGVVTQFTFQAVKPATTVTSFTYNWGFEHNFDILKALNQFQAIAPRDIGLEMEVGPGGLQLFGVYGGGRAELETVIGPLLNMAPTPKTKVILEDQYINALLRFSNIAGDPKDIEALALKGNNKALNSHYTKGKSLLFPSLLQDSTLQLVGKWVGITPVGSTGSSIKVTIWGGAVSDVKADATSFVHRNALSGMVFTVEWNKDPDAKPGIPDCLECLKWMDDMYSEFLQDFKTNYGSIAGYQNCIDRGIPNWQDAYYGQAFPKLKQIKKDVDPQNVFRFPQSIPLP